MKFFNSNIIRLAKYFPISSSMATSNIQDPAGPTRPSVIFTTHENTSNTTNELILKSEGPEIEILEPEGDYTLQSNPILMTKYNPLSAKVRRLRLEIFQLRKDRQNDRSRFQEIISHLERKNAELDKRNRILTHNNYIQSKNIQQNDEGATKSAETNEISKKGLTSTEVASLLETKGILQYILRLSEMVYSRWPDTDIFTRQKTKMDRVLCRLKESLWQLEKAIKKQEQE